MFIANIKKIVRNVCLSIWILKRSALRVSLGFSNTILPAGELRWFARLSWTWLAWFESEQSHVITDNDQNRKETRHKSQWQGSCVVTKNPKSVSSCVNVNFLHLQLHTLDSVFAIHVLHTWSLDVGLLHSSYWTIMCLPSQTVSLNITALHFTKSRRSKKNKMQNIPVTYQFRFSGWTPPLLTFEFF